MIHYLVQTIVFQALFLLVYDLFLKKETFFNWNRAYLIATAILSFVIPWIRVEAINQRLGQDFAVQLPAVFLGNTPGGAVPTVAAAEPFNWNLIWIAGMSLACVWLLIKLFKIIQFRTKGKTVRFDDFVLTSVANSNNAFSFFKNVFLGEQLPENKRKVVLEHELVHVRQWHSIDLVFFEILKIVFWFNPLMYLYQSKLRCLHEFIADAYVARQQGRVAYSEELLSQVFGTQQISFVNTFFNHSLIKKRIIMLQKSKSSKVKLLKFITALPLVLAMVLYASCSQGIESKSEGDLAANETEVMVKIEELSEAIMKKGNLTERERKALEFLATPAKEGDPVYESVDEYLEKESLLSQRMVDSTVIETQDLTDIPFAVIDKVPTYPGCTGTNKELKDCMSQKISQFVNSEFDIKMADSLKLKGTQRIFVKFKINKQGEVVDIASRAAHPKLQEEAARVVSKIPKMIPGEHEGKKVGVLYALPIMFKLAD